MSGVFVGKTLDGFPIELADNIRQEHVQIIASTGRGKTSRVILPWMLQDYLGGKDVVMVDGKGDRSIVDFFKDFVGCKAKDVIVFDLGDLESSAVTNPLKFGTPQQVADRIFATFEFESSYYESVAYEALLLVLEIKRALGEEFRFREIYQALTDDATLTELAAGLGESDLSKLALAYLARPARDRKEDLAGLLSQLRPFAIGEVSTLVNGELEGRESFSLSEIVRKDAGATNKAVLLLIPHLLYQRTASRLGQMFLQEIAWASVARGSNRFLPVFLDEFSSFVYEGFLQLLNKARSSGIGLHICHQSMGDLEAVGADFAKAIVTNTNVKCVLGVNEPETAEFFAKLFGTRASQKSTERAERKPVSGVEMSGIMSIRDVEQYRVHPNRLKAFAKGEGVLSFMVNGEMLIEEVQYAGVPESDGAR